MKVVHFSNRSSRTKTLQECYAAAIRAQVYRDSDPFKRDLFADLLQRSRVIRYGYNLCSSNNLFASITCVLFFVYRLLAIRPRKRALIIAAPVFGNEKRILATEISPATLAKMYLAEKHKQYIIPNLLRIFPLLYILGNLFFVFRQSAILLRRSPLFVAMRAAELTAYFIYLKRAVSQAKLVIVTTDNNPNGNALFFLAEALDKRSLFISHGEPNPPLHRFHVDMAVLFGEVSKERYRKCGAQIEEVLFHGHKELQREMRPVALSEIDCVGIFLSKFNSRENLVKLISQINRNFQPGRILLREHPNFRLQRGLRAELIRLGAKTSHRLDIYSDIERCDLIVAGNTTSHLEVLLSGCPSLYYYDGVKEYRDRYGYVASGLILEMDDSVTPTCINEFYTGAANKTQISKHLSISQTRAESRTAIQRWIEEQVEKQF